MSVTLSPGRISEAKLGRKLSEEHKKKIGKANKIALKKFHKNNPNYKNNGMFKKGEGWPKGKPRLSVREEKHPNWNGGIQSYRKILKRRGIEIKECSKCGINRKLVVHHIDKNRKNNDINNLQILCFKCHNDLHEIGVKTRFKKKQGGKE